MSTHDPSDPPDPPLGERPPHGLEEMHFGRMANADLSASKNALPMPLEVPTLDVASSLELEYPTRRLDRNQAKKLIAEIRQRGSVTPTGHCKKELTKDRMSMGDAINVLRCGNIVEEAEMVKGAYRYRVHTEWMCVVVEFQSDKELRLITGWRK